MQWSRIYRPPIVGLMAFMVVLIVQPLGHTVMILMENILGHAYVYWSALAMGFLGAYLTWIGRNKGETAATMLGFFGGTFLWTGWVEFSFVFYADHLSIADLMAGGDIATKNEYLVMPSSIGVMMATLVFFYFNRDTRCNLFRWMHRNLHMDPGPMRPGRDRNIAALVAMETIYVVWFFYIALLLLYDNAFLGDQHPALYAIFFANLTWAMYLFNRLMKYSRMASAVRYAIPTAIILWNNIEILGRWDFFKEIWVHPEDHAIEMAIVAAALVTCTVITMLVPARKSPDAEPEAVTPAE